MITHHRDWGPPFPRNIDASFFKGNFYPKLVLAGKNASTFPHKHWARAKEEKAWQEVWYDRSVVGTSFFCCKTVCWLYSTGPWRASFMAQKFGKFPLSFRVLICSWKKGVVIDLAHENLWTFARYKLLIHLQIHAFYPSLLSLFNLGFL